MNRIVELALLVVFVVVLVLLSSHLLSQHPSVSSLVGEEHYVPRTGGPPVPAEEISE